MGITMKLITKLTLENVPNHGIGLVRMDMRNYLKDIPGFFPENLCVRTMDGKKASMQYVPDMMSGGNSDTLVFALPEGGTHALDIYYDAASQAESSADRGIRFDLSKT